MPNPHQIHKSKKASKSVRKVTAELAEILAVLRLLPFDARLEPFSIKAWPRLEEELRDKYPEFWNWCAHNDPPTSDHCNPTYRYGLAVSWIEALRAAVRQEPVMQVPVIAIRDKESDALLVDNRFYNLLPDIQLSRLRECPECLHIYYARRSDQGHCGNPRCKTRLSSKKFYDKPEIKERLQLYYESKKKRARARGNPQQSGSGSSVQAKEAG
jgi:hypothetical protein